MFPRVVANIILSLVVMNLQVLAYALPTSSTSLTTSTRPSPLCASRATVIDEGILVDHNARVDSSRTRKVSPEPSLSIYPREVDAVDLRDSDSSSTSTFNVQSTQSTSAMSTGLPTPSHAALLYGKVSAMIILSMAVIIMALFGCYLCLSAKPHRRWSNSVSDGFLDTLQCLSDLLSLWRNCNYKCCDCDCSCEDVCEGCCNVCCFCCDGGCSCGDCSGDCNCNC